MVKPKSTLEIYRLLEQSNCGKCGEKTCLAFAAAVFRKQRIAGECPQLSAEAVEQLSGPASDGNNNDQDPAEFLKGLKSEAAAMDFSAAAERTGGSFDGNRLTLKVLGKNFAIDTKGDLFADIHINHWIAVPFLDYVIHGKEIALSGKWVPFRELREGRERYPLFQKRCEEPMKKVADNYASLFDDMVHVLGGKQVEEQFESDISVVLNPLPKVPIMICYWQPDDGLDSSLNVFFDETADQHLDIGSAFMLGVGLSQMFTKIGQTHGFAGG
jgi:hypothetical protein